MSMRLSPSESGSSGILFIGFNQDHSCFAVGTQNGFRIFNSDPLKLLERYDFDVHEGTGIGYLEMLYRTNLLGMLGGGHYARLPSNVACLWDGVKKHFLLDITCSSEVKAIRLRRDRIILVLMDAIKVYTFGPTPMLIYETSTSPNPLGLCQVCQAFDNHLLAFPARRPGDVLLVHVGLSGTSASSTNATSLQPPRQIVAHEHPLAALSLNQAGSLLATASQKGTLVRIFSTKECELLYEVRRGINPATITSLCFSQASDMVCVTSERGTAHIFALRPKKGRSYMAAAARDDRSSGQQRASSSGSQEALTNFSQVRCVLETRFKAICAFSQLDPNTLIVLATDGSYYKYSFTPNGSITRVAFVNFLDFYDDDMGI